MAKPKIEHYCAYQERCHSEVKNKLFELGLYPNEVDALIAEMIVTGFLNEERFAKAYAGGKFRTKHWGRIKIRQELKFRKLTDYCIKKGMAEISDSDYEKTLSMLIEKKMREVRGGTLRTRQQKVLKYLMSKGYETENILKALKAAEQEPEVIQNDI
ncbi:MAG: RecX family transcriptional regulator [Bacteroidia bacterium]|nr:RecX family transcriptional regulator [Bacteroidia bacterium]